MDFRNEQPLSPQSLLKTCTKHSTGYFPELVWASPQSPGKTKELRQTGFRSISTTPFFPYHQGQQLHRTWCLVMHRCCHLEFFQMNIDQKITAFSFYTGSHQLYDPVLPVTHPGWKDISSIKLRPGRVSSISILMPITNKSTCPVVPSILKVCSACSKCNWTICLELYIKLKTIFLLNYIHATFMFSRFEIYFSVFIAT